MWKVLYVFFGLLAGLIGFLTAYTSYVLFSVDSIDLAFLISYIVSVAVYYVIRTPIIYNRSELLYVGTTGALVYFALSVFIGKYEGIGDFSILHFPTSIATSFAAALFFLISFVITGILINFTFEKSESRNSIL